MSTQQLPLYHTLSLPTRTYHAVRMTDMEIEEDAADREARLKAQAAAREEEARLRRSQVMQRGLPRPLTLDGLPQPLPIEQQPSLGLRAQAEQLVLQELKALLAHDAAKYPLQGRKRGREEPADLERELSMELLQQVGAVQYVF